MAPPNHGIGVTVFSGEGGNGMTAGNSHTATRCPACGRRSVESGLCGTCGSGIHLPSGEEAATVIPSPIPRQPVFAMFTPEPRSLAVSQASRIPASGFSQRVEMWISRRTDQVSGRVVIVRQAPHETMDFDPWRWLAIPVWGLVLLMAPFAMAIVVWKTYGIAPAILVAVVSLLVLRFIFSDRLIQSWHLTAALNGRHIVEPMPVLMVRLRQSDEREIQLRLKGHLHGGALMEGDRIRSTGAWRRGVFRVSSITCERTGATIEPRQPNARILAITGSCILLLGILWLLLAGIPWVRHQADRFRSSVSQSDFPALIDLQKP